MTSLNNWPKNFSKHTHNLPLMTSDQTEQKRMFCKLKQRIKTDLRENDVTQKLTHEFHKTEL